jgi:histidyl-tRNA synthetase
VDHTKFGPPKGMRDFLPGEVLLRQKLIHLIESHYQLYGFQPIDTPVMENIEVLQGKGGGENEKLMFKVLKRGEDLEKGRASGDYADMGLRFDLTVPLARFYANHAHELPRPFRCSHIGPVWRADRPQKGRFREFYQCDIDIVGGASDACEVELLLATDRVLKALDLGRFKIRLSDKRLLPDLLTGMGVEASKVAGVAGALDKLDKQPVDQVWKEIEVLGHSLEVLNKVDGFLKNALDKKLDPVHFKIGQAEELWMRIDSIRKRVHEVNPDAQVVFDPLLVRGFDYYTGPVFEINVENQDFSFSIGGGGRYDGLIEKLGGPPNTPAVGISLGFERLLLILAGKDGEKSGTSSSTVYLANNGQPEKDRLALAEQLRAGGIRVEASLENRKLGPQLEAAQKNGIEFAVTAFHPDGKSLKVRRLSTREDKDMSPGELKAALKALGG